MTTVQTWQQESYIRPNQQLYRKPGDFCSIDDFIPSPDGTYLERAPAWSDHITYPSDFKEPLHATYHALYDDLVIIGSSEAGSPDVVGTFYLDEHDLSKSAVQSSSGAPTDMLNYRHKQEAYFVFDDFWYVGNDGNVYKADNMYGTASSAVYTGGDARAIIPARDTIYLLTSTDQFLRWNEDDSAFESLYDNWLHMGGTFIAHYHDEFVLLAYEIDGTPCLFSFDQVPPVELRQIARLPAYTGELTPDTVNGRWGTPWALHHDAIYFSPGAWLTPDDTFEKVPILRYNGSRVELVDTVEVPVSPYAWGLTSWRDRLVLYFLGDADQHIMLLHNDRFTDFLTPAATLSVDSDLYSVGSHLMMMTTVGENAGLVVTRYKATDSVFVSSWLDMGHPSSQKHLSRLVAIVSGQCADFKVKIEYRTESGSWTQATEQANARHVDAGDLGVAFNLLQIRVTFTEEIDPKTYPDVRLESLAATYSLGVR